MARVKQHPPWYLHLLEWSLIVVTLRAQKFRFELRFYKQFNLSNLPQFIVQYKIPNCPNFLSIHHEKILRIWVPKFLAQHKKPLNFLKLHIFLHSLETPFSYTPQILFSGNQKSISQWGCQLATGVKVIAKEKYAVWAPEKKKPWVHNLIFNSFCFGVFFYAILTTIK